MVNQSFVLADSQQQQSTLLEELIDLTDSGQKAQVELLSDMRRSIADDLASAMIKALDQIRADRRQSDNTMVEELSRCLNSMSEEFNSSIKIMVQQFHNTVRDMAGEEIDRFAGQLKELHSEYVSANEQLVSTNSDMLGKVIAHSSNTLEQTREITCQLSESTTEVTKYTDDLYTKFTHLQRDMQQWVFDTLEDSRSVIHSDLVAAGYSLKNNALEAGQLLINGADKASEQLDSAGGTVHQNLQAAIESLRESVELSGQRLTQQMSEAGDIVKSAGAQVSNDLSGTSEIVTAIHTDLQKTGVQLLQDMFEGAGYIFHDQVKQAGEELLIGSQKAVENFAACGASFSHEITEAGNALQDGMSHFVAAGDALKVNALEAGQLLINGAGNASNKLETAGDIIKSAGAQVSNDLSGTSERISAVHTDLQQKGVQLIQELFEGAGSTFQDQVTKAGNVVACEMARGAQEVSEQQKVWTERHEKAVADMVHHVETSTANMHDLGKEVLGEWSVKVADASSALVMVAKDSSRMAESIEPVLEVQRDIANELVSRTEALLQASKNSEKAQEQIAAGLYKASESYQLLATCIEDVSESSGVVENQLRNLTEEFAAQHDRFSANISSQFEKQRASNSQWEKTVSALNSQWEKTVSALIDGHSKRVHGLDVEITKAMSNVNDGLLKFGGNVREFITGLDKNSSEILQTLSAAIDEMKSLDDKKSADELRSLSAIIREHEKAVTKIELDMRQCPAYPGGNKVA